VARDQRGARAALKVSRFHRGDKAATLVFLCTRGRGAVSYRRYPFDNENSGGHPLEINPHAAYDFLKTINRRDAVWGRLGFRRRSIANDFAIGMLID